MLMLQDYNKSFFLFHLLMKDVVASLFTNDYCNFWNADRFYHLNDVSNNNVYWISFGYIINENFDMVFWVIQDYRRAIFSLKSKKILSTAEEESNYRPVAKHDHNTTKILDLYVQFVSVIPGWYESIWIVVIEEKVSTKDPTASEFFGKKKALNHLSFHQSIVFTLQRLVKSQHSTKPHPPISTFTDIFRIKTGH